MSILQSDTYAIIIFSPEKSRNITHARNLQYIVCESEEQLQSQLWSLTLNESCASPWPVVASKDPRYNNISEKLSEAVFWESGGD
jgi:nicotinamide mononucleotide adenylyltransferase